MSKKNISYILKRLILAVLTVWVVITLTFFVMRAVPGGPFMSEKLAKPSRPSRVANSARLMRSCGACRRFSFAPMSSVW